ncbi:hypothetical protein E2C01_100282 [Portunus trituberculatus]|uniref:Uncharacterized protein n=1 Tax=Portunus trituberculatus TaxID=210409 RepID=A0A5B7KCM5_PORTR|nr:hypothetical protein [Portunus trituberculatus]
MSIALVFWSHQGRAAGRGGGGGTVRRYWQ